MSRGQGRLFKPDNGRGRTNIWWLDYSVRGERHRESSGTTVQRDAQRLLRERIGGRESGRLTGTPDKVMFADLRALAEQQYQLDGRRSLPRLRQLFAHLQMFFGPARAMDITPVRLDAYQLHRGREGAARATVNRELSALRLAFRLAVKKGLLATRPEFQLAKEDNVRTGFFEADDLAALLAELPLPLRPVAVFAYLTGWRRQEILRLTWATVDFDAGVIRLEVGSTKNGEGRTFPMRALPELEQLMRAQWGARDGLFVFHRRGQPIRDFYAAWHNACRRAATVTHANGVTEIVRPQLIGRIPHDFRRTAVRNLVRAGVPERVAMQLTGHKTRSVFDRYDIVNEKDLTDGVAKLAALHANGQQAANISTSHAPTPRVTSIAS